MIHHDARRVHNAVECLALQVLKLPESALQVLKLPESALQVLKLPESALQVLKLPSEECGSCAATL